MPPRSETEETGRWHLGRLDPGPWPARAAVIGLALIALLSQFLVETVSSRLAGAGLALLLAWISVIDARRWIIPDLLSFPLILSGLVLAAGGGIGVSLRDSVIAAVLGYGLLAGLAYAYKAITGRPGLGLGDAKLLAGCGAWLGWMALPWLLMIASASGLGFVLAQRAMKPAERPVQAVAFGPHLALGGWICWLGLPFIFLI